MSLDEGTIVKTGPKAYLKLRLAEGSLLELGAYSRLRLILAKPSNKVSLGLEAGRVKARVEHRPDGKRNFHLKTKSTTMGVRGTEFVVAIFATPSGAQNAEYYCQDGSIEVEGAAEGSSALLTAGYGVSVMDHAKTLRTIKIPAKILEQVAKKSFLIDTPAPAPIPAREALGGKTPPAERERKLNLPAVTAGGGAGNIPVPDGNPVTGLLGQ